MPLLILVVQAYLFAALLLVRFTKKRHLADLFLAIFILMNGHHCTSYIIGFMDWYDTYRNTKINYFLMNFGLALGPVLYFYIRSLTDIHFKFRKRDWWHFVPIFVVVLYKVVLWHYDSRQPGFEDVHNGVLMENFHRAFILTISEVAHLISKIIYFTLAIQLYMIYRKNIQAFFSNTFRVELNWMRNFLIAYMGLFAFGILMTIVNEFVELHWTQNWWTFFFTSVTMVYIGMMGYFTDLSKLYNLTFNAQGGKLKALKDQEQVLDHLDQSYTENEQNQIDEACMGTIRTYMDAHQPYLDAELTLSELARQVQLSPSQVSQAINTGFGMNFNEFINQYRVEAVKSILKKGEKSNLSMLGIAMECGFNSKATFNRTFKKFTQLTPSEYVASQKAI
ncbi:MAG: AraC family transcriptional regulator [Bacteroidota bacterium]